MDERTPERAEMRWEKRQKKRTPKMRVSGRGMKRFAKRSK